MDEIELALDRGFFGRDVATAHAGYYIAGNRRN
jgi:hypothetical protein